MKYIGNYKDWIDPKWMEMILTTEGRPRPLEWNQQTEATIETEVFGDEKNLYPKDAIHWWLYDKKELDITLVPPWCKNEFHWWFVKTTPGQFMSVHSDADFLEYECNRYWVAMQDYQLGHVFIYGEQGDILKNYKAGDVFMFENSALIHAAANLSTNTRVVLQIAEVK